MAGKYRRRTGREPGSAMSQPGDIRVAEHIGKAAAGPAVQGGNGGDRLDRSGNDIRPQPLVNF